ncbi:MAG: NADH-quinone oxidoreductase subunit D, partial [Deltaproteobacteria bacterium]
MSMQLEDPRIVEFDVRTDEMLVNMGPQHPSTHGVLRLLLKTDGEVVHEVTPHIGYLHRCAEKIGENLAPQQWIPYTDRMDYLAGMNMNLGWSLAVEKLIGMEVPEKAMVLRLIISEMGRIASHLVGMGAYGLDLGTFSPFLYAFREREIILDLFEEVCGARLTYSYITIGGATHDLPEKITIPPGLAALTGHKMDLSLSWIEACTIFLDWLDKRVPEYHTLLTENQIFI